MCDTCKSPEELSDMQHRNLKPIDLEDNEKYTTKNIRDLRYDICMSCKNLISLTKMCQECGCFVSIKTWNKEDNCPINLW